jgi:hypothetical protein
VQGRTRRGGRGERRSLVLFDEEKEHDSRGPGEQQWDPRKEPVDDLTAILASSPRGAEAAVEEQTVSEISEARITIGCQQMPQSMSTHPSLTSALSVGTYGGLNTRISTLPCRRRARGERRSQFTASMRRRRFAEAVLNVAMHARGFRSHARITGRVACLLANSSSMKPHTAPEPGPTSTTSAGSLLSTSSMSDKMASQSSHVSSWGSYTCSKSAADRWSTDGRRAAIAQRQGPMISTSLRASPQPDETVHDERSVAIIALYNTEVVLKWLKD